MRHANHSEIERNDLPADADRGRGGPFPSDGTAATETGKRPHPTDPGRWADGTVRAGNRAALKHGKYAATAPELLAAEPKTSASSSYRTQLETDQGGPDDLPAVTRAYCHRLTELEAVLRSIAANLVEHGIFTPRGRPRSALDAYLATVGTWDRVAMRLGLERKKKDVLDLSLADYLAATQHTEGEHDAAPHHAPAQTDENTSVDGGADPTERHRDAGSPPTPAESTDRTAAADTSISNKE
jgi:hypothetical protein